MEEEEAVFGQCERPASVPLLSTFQRTILDFSDCFLIPSSFERTASSQAWDFLARSSDTTNISDSEGPCTGS